MSQTKFKCILADPPWPQSMSGQRKRIKEGKRPTSLSYPTMTVDSICNMSIQNFADDDCHLWLWTTNQFLRDGFKVMEHWGFKYLAPIHWIKPSGIGCWFVHRTQTLLFGYRKKCIFGKERYRPNILMTGDPVRHSQKPDVFYELIESISNGPYLELFARQKRKGWNVWGNEVEKEINL